MDRQAVVDGMIFNFKSGHPSQYVLKEVLIDRCYGFDFSKGNDIVLNLGGHRGAFDLFASPKVKQIITFEPEEEAHTKLAEHLLANYIKNVRFYKGAVINGEQETVSLNIIGSGHNSVITTAGNTPVEEVIAYDIKKILKQYEFTKVKCDIEGGERNFIDIVRPETINEMFFEIHLFDDHARTDYTKFFKNLICQKFSLNELENDNGMGRTLLLHCKR